MAHVYVHEGRSGKEMVCFCRNDGYAVIAQFSEMPGCSNSCYSIPNNYNMLHTMANYAQIGTSGSVSMSAQRPVEIIFQVNAFSHMRGY